MVSNEPNFSVDWAPDAIVVTRSDGSVLHVNARAEDLFGYRKDELSDKPLELLIPEGLPSAGPESSPLQHVSRAVVCAHRDGTHFRGTARWRPAPAGHGDFVVFAIRDLVGEVPADAARDAEESPRVELLSLFAHDVRESLQAVQYLCDALRDRAPVEAAAVSEITGSISTLLERLARRSGAEALEPLVEPCELDELLGALGRELMPLAERKGLRLSVHGDGDVIATDRVLLRELLHNLVANAIRYTDAGQVDVRCSAGTDHVRVEIIDTGVGIAPARLAAMLGPDGHGPGPGHDHGHPDAEAVDDPSPPDGAADDADRTSNPHGAGLGLAIVHQLTRLLGCAIEVDSMPGRGSSFTVVVPRAIKARRRREHDGA